MSLSNIIEIKRQHHLSLEQAKELATQWQASAESDWQLQCQHEDRENSDTISFKRSGVSGTLVITEKAFILNMKLGFLLKPYRQRITQAIEDNLTQCLETFQS